MFFDKKMMIFRKILDMLISMFLTVSTLKVHRTKVVGQIYTFSLRIWLGIAKKPRHTFASQK